MIKGQFIRPDFRGKLHIVICAHIHIIYDIVSGRKCVHKPARSDCPLFIRPQMPDFQIKSGTRFDPLNQELFKISRRNRLREIISLHDVAPDGLQRLQLFLCLHALRNHRD